MLFFHYCLHCWQQKVTPIWLSDFSYSFLAKTIFFCVEADSFYPLAFFFMYYSHLPKRSKKHYPLQCGFLHVIPPDRSDTNVFDCSILAWFCRNWVFLKWLIYNKNILIWNLKSAWLLLKLFILNFIYLCPTCSQNQILEKTQITCG